MTVLRGWYFTSSLDAQLDSINAYLVFVCALPTMPVPTVDQTDIGITEISI